ncbi:MAG: response regulator [Arcobacteraceae bacterium]|jgi:two-component system chemotaxis response regulator CheY|nr:response regulator [Arcobacteraceae bacterium]
MARVLIVDDIGIMRHTIKGHLIKLGHIVVGEASNGDEAIHQYKMLKPDVVTMDVTMPAFNGILSGIEALKHIKEYDNDAKVVMLTSHGEQKTIMDAIKIGAKGYILKPVNADKLEATFNKLALS